MKKTNSIRLLTFTFCACIVIHISNAQMASGHPKFVGNIVGSTVPANFDLYWNQVTPENSGKWGTVEGARDVMNWADLDIAYNHAQLNGYDFKQHAFVWGIQEPVWVSGLSQAEQEAELEEWIQLYAQRYPNTQMIDVVNEPLHVVPSYANAIGGNGSTGWDWVVWSFQKARQYCPNAQLILNDYGILGKKKATTDYIKIINILKAQNLIDGIGVQAHGLEYAQNSAITSSLNDLAATGLPIYISELDLEFADDSDQLNRYQSLFPLLYEHPGVVGVTLWGYVAGEHWKPNAYLLGELNNLGSLPLNTTFQDYTFTGSGSIQVHLTNDDTNNSHDAEVDYVVLDGTTHQAEDMVINTGVWQDNSCGGSFSQWLQCNGYIQFPHAAQDITVRARGVLGTETMEVHAVDLSIERPALNWLRTVYFAGSNNPPLASFGHTSNLLMVDFDASASSDSDGTITNWSWDFGDGNTASGVSVSHTYAVSGNYSVTLTVTDDGGAMDTDVQTISVSDGNNPPTASFSFSTNVLSVDFDATTSADSDGTIVGWNWNFGDGNTGTGQFINHNYASSGAYTVVLTIIDDGGATDTETQSVVVSDGSGSTTMHIQSIITYSLGAGQGSKRGVAEITVHDDQENTVEEAMVTGIFSGTFNETVSGQTGADGVVILQTTGTAKGSIIVNICVDDVTGSLSYDPGMNDIICTGGNGRYTTEESDLTKQLAIYPNPVTNGNFSISLDRDHLSEDPINLAIYNLNGRLVYQDVFQGTELTISLGSSLNQGIYLLELTGKDLHVRSKLIVR